MTNPSVFLLPLLIAITAALIGYWLFPRAASFVANWVATHPAARTAQNWLASPQVLDRIAAIFIFVAMVGFPLIALHTYQDFGSFRDNVDFDISLWNVLHGEPVEAMLNFSRRFNPILLALIPLYALWSDPRILLILQSIGIAGAAFPLYWFSRKTIGRPLGLLIALTYLVYPSIYYLNRPAIFYEIKLAIPVLAFAIYFLLKKKYMPFLACLVVALFIKQEISLIAIGFGFLLFFAQRQRKLGIGIAAIGAGLVLFVTLFLYPSLNQGQGYPQFAERYSYLGNTLDQVILTLVREPGIIFQYIATPPKIDFVAALLVPLALLPFVGIEIVAISFPAWAYTLMSELPQQIDPTQYYQSPLLPFLFFGAAIGLRRILGHSSKTSPANPTNFARRQFALALLLIASSQLYLPAIWLRIFDPSQLFLSAHSQLGHQLINQIPREGIIAAQEEFFIPLFVERRRTVYDFAPRADYRQSVDYLFGDSTRKWYGYQQSTWEQWRVSGFFETLIDQDGYFLLHRRPIVNPTRQIDDGWALVGYADSPNPFMQRPGLQFQDSFAVLGYAAVPSQSIRGGDLLHVMLESRALKNISDSLIFLLQVEDEQGHLWTEDGREPMIPTARWQSGDLIRDHYALTLSRIMPPGDYRITLGIWNPKANTSLEASDSTGRSRGIRPVLGKIHVEKDTRSFTADMLAIEQPLRADLGELRYLGSTNVPAEIEAGGKFSVGVYWRARLKPKNNYDVAIQLRDSTGRIAIEQTQEPAAGAYPTLLWQPGEILLDWHDLALPTDLRPDQYTLTVVVRDRTNRAILGQVDIGQIQIKK